MPEVSDSFAVDIEAMAEDGTISAVVWVVSTVVAEASIVDATIVVCVALMLVADESSVVWVTLIFAAERSSVVWVVPTVLADASKIVWVTVISDTSAVWELSIAVADKSTVVWVTSIAVAADSVVTVVDSIKLSEMESILEVAVALDTEFDGWETEEEVDAVPGHWGREDASVLGELWSVEPHASRMLPVVTVPKYKKMLLIFIREI